MDVWGFGPNRDTFEALLAAYSGRGRHYHSVEHIRACLHHLDGCRSSLERPQELELALWFHDAVYLALSSRNEQRSADWAARFLSDNGAEDAAVKRVHRLIMVTAHDAGTLSGDEAAMVDIDLAILGAEPAVYDRFEQDVRKEYRFVPWFIYRRKRANLLRGFLARPTIYTSGCFPRQREQQARVNLGRAIACLEELSSRGKP